ncbi:hypothetical protein [Christiangramia sp. SM2212]|uniref:Lipoprotein n=1 Tax=Christiangramia sediminicola TaxID=3073267 RepID=A0ABU1ENI4_9FLAO|nr:hypothetical protein [Christiangramia sp. SM2212]MDR5589938.1 hypothetical protein [Christiangramia sp. SM2212]
MIKRLLIIFPIFIFSFGCQNKDKNEQGKNEKVDKSNFYLKDNIEIKFNNDTIPKNGFLKAILILKKSKFQQKNSKIIVAIEDSLDILKQNLSNERKTFLTIFQNLEYDSINRKFFKQYDPKKTVAFGKQMKNIGSHKLRGYVMEYYDIQVGPQYDITSDSLSKQRNKIYFEKTITVVPN